MTDEKRGHVVMARFNSDEVARLDALRKPFRLSRAKFMRMRALDERLPKVMRIPELNAEAWATLSRSASNLNQIAHKVNMGMYVDMGEIRAELSEFRQRLVGADKSMGVRKE